MHVAVDQVFSAMATTKVARYSPVFSYLALVFLLKERE